MQDDEILAIVQDHIKIIVVCNPFKRFRTVKADMGGVAFVVPVEKTEFVRLSILRRVELGHHRTVSVGRQPGGDFFYLFAGVFEVLESFRGDDQIVSCAFFEFREKIRVISFSLIPGPLQQGFQDRFVATAVIENSLDVRAVVLDEVYFLLEHVDVAFVIEAVFMFEVTLDFFFRGNEKPGRDKNEPAGRTEVVLAPVRFD